jgi:GT2 family glycosyltransferase
LSQSTTNQPLVAISVLNWNGWQDTIECLESVRRLDYPNYLTVVVDNGSSNGSADKIKAWAEANLGPGHVIADYSCETALAGGDPETEQALDLAPLSARLVLIRNEENLGFAGGNNVTIHYALQRCSVAGYVFLLNNDATVRSDSVRQLVDAGHVTNAGIVGARVVEQGTGRELFGGRAPLFRQFFSPLLVWQLPPPDPRMDIWESQFVSGSAMLIRRDLLEAIRAETGTYLEDRLFLYGEEHALAFRAYRLGFKSVLAGQGVAYHKPVRVNGNLSKPLSFYYGTRNRIYLAGLILPLPLKMLFHPFNLALTAASTAKKIVNHRTREATAMLHGFADGYRGISGKWKRHDQEVHTGPKYEG